jgi:hypothetical protein
MLVTDTRGGAAQRSMITRLMIRGLFVVAALYDGILGLAFLVVGPALFGRLGIPPPNHWGYVHFPALLLLIFAAAFAAVAYEPVSSRNLIPYGVSLKLAYCGTVFYHWAAGGIPGAWKPFAFIDLVFAALFVWAHAALGRRGTAVH